MLGLGTGELVVIMGVVLLVFGGSRLPELGRGLGQGMRSFRDALRGTEGDGEAGQNLKPGSKTVSKGSETDSKTDSETSEEKK